MGVLVDGRLDVSQQRAWEHSREGEVGFVHPMESVRHFRAPHATTIILILISGRQVSIQKQKSPLGQCLPQDRGDWERCRGVVRCVLQPQGCGCLTHPPQDPVSPFSKQPLPQARFLPREACQRPLSRASPWISEQYQCCSNHTCRAQHCRRSERHPTQAPCTDVHIWHTRDPFPTSHLTSELWGALPPTSLIRHRCAGHLHRWRCLFPG